MIEIRPCLAFPCQVHYTVTEYVLLRQVHRRDDSIDTIESWYS
jgi:hypothetical protein